MLKWATVEKANDSGMTEQVERSQYFCTLWLLQDFWKVLRCSGLGYLQFHV